VILTAATVAGAALVIAAFLMAFIPRPSPTRRPHRTRLGAQVKSRLTEALISAEARAGHGRPDALGTMPDLP